MKKLVCIGDSHASFFSGMDIIQPEYPEVSDNKIPFLEGIRLGAVLAYSLHKENTTYRGREKLFEIISKLDQKNSAILFCFGEIDCRYHLLKIAENTGEPINSVIEKCVDAYFGVIEEVSRKGFEVIVWNVIPTSSLNDNTEYPHFGTAFQRNTCTRKFNDMLRVRCGEKKILFIDVFNRLVTRNLNTKEYYFFDGVHLGQLAMPYFIKKINKYFPQINNSNLSTSEWKIREFYLSVIFKLKKIKRAVWHSKKIKTSF